jgi:5,6-dimethylbenzimidazole synthase
MQAVFGRRTLPEMPEGSQSIAMLCLGPVAAFDDQPMLQAQKWASRADVADLVFTDIWGHVSRG